MENGNDSLTVGGETDIMTGGGLDTFIMQQRIPVTVREGQKGDKECRLLCYYKG